MLYELPIIKHLDAETIEEALSWLHQCGGTARVLAGGTDLLGLLKDRVMGPKMPLPQVLISVKPIVEMNQVFHDNENGLRIGCATPLSRVENFEIIREKFPILLAAIQQVATTQLRNMGTIGGNLCQRPQCLYFRHPDFPCYKKGGTKCHALAGEHRDYHSVFRQGRCVMAHPSDLGPVLVALNARAIIATRNHEKEVPIEDFFLGANDLKETILQDDELLKEIRVPEQGPQSYQIYLKHRVRHASDFALASAALAVQIREGTCQKVRLVLGGVAPYPYLISKAEEMMRGKILTRALIADVAELSVEEARPLPMNRYKLDLTKALTRRVLTSIQHLAKLSET